MPRFVSLDALCNVSRKAEIMARAVDRPRHVNEVHIADDVPQSPPVFAASDTHLKRTLFLHHDHVTRAALTVDVPLDEETTASPRPRFRFALATKGAMKLEIGTFAR
jgi:hypothetical protein